MSGILDDFPRGLGKERLSIEQKAPQAQWHPAEEIRDDPKLEYNPENPGGKLLLGCLGKTFIGVEDDRHMITVAGSRAGKGVSVIVPNLLFYPGSVLAIDPKGELAAITGRRRKLGLKQKVYVLDPFHRTPDYLKDYRGSFNPMGILTNDNPHIIEDAGLIADALVVPGGGNEIHWDETARNFIEGVILHVATDPAYEGRRNLVTVRELLVRGAEPSPALFPDEKAKQAAVDMVGSLRMAALWIEMDSNQALDGYIQAAATEMFERDSKEMNSVLSSARRHTTFLGFPAMKNVLVDHPELKDLRALKTQEEGMTIYLCLPAGRLATCNRWLRLFVNLALEAMEREARVAPGRENKPVLLCLDEFATLGRMEQVEAAAGQIAGFGCKLWPILQDLGQLEALYKDRWQTFVGNAGVLQFFGNNDVKTLEYISKRLGLTTILGRSLADGQGKEPGSAQTQFSWAPQSHPLMTAEEVGRFFARNAPFRRQLVIRASKEPPMALGRVVYHDRQDPLYKAFAGKYDDPDNSTGGSAPSQKDDGKTNFLSRLFS